MTSDIVWAIAVPVAQFVGFLLAPLVGLSILNSVRRVGA